jgi:hypothetical protein
LLALSWLGLWPSSANERTLTTVAARDAGLCEMHPSIALRNEPNSAEVLALLQGCGNFQVGSLSWELP